MATTKKLMGTTAVGGALAIEDVFSTYLYTGNGSTQTITNGIDLAGEGGMVWTKIRSSAQDNVVVDSERGGNKLLRVNKTDAEYSSTYLSFNSDGYNINNAFALFNASASTYVSWTFRKAPRFFDAVTYTGNGVAGRQIPHNLGVVPGCIIIKQTDVADDWVVRHRSLSSNNHVVFLNATIAESSNTAYFNSTDATDATITLGTSHKVNESGGTFVAYLFAHDPLGPSEDGSDGLIACGSYTGNGSTAGPVIDLGWEPQWLLVKDASSGGTNWILVDSMRGFTATGVSDAFLKPNASDAEDVGSYFAPTATGFILTDNSSFINSSGNTYIYIAIRRGPMRQPESGTEVFQPVAYTGTNTDNRLVDTGILTDMVLARIRTTTSSLGFVVGDRLRGDNFLGTASANIEATDADSLDQLTSGYGNAFSAMNGFGVGNDATRLLNGSSTSQLAYAFKRAPGFFDAVAYTGVNSVLAVNHNLSAIPEMIIFKNRSSGGTNWSVYHKDIGPTAAIYLNLGSNPVVFNGFFNDTAPTDTQFTVNFNGTTGGFFNYIAYLFATLPGVSKVGSYTGNGSSQTIDCGFTSGARFVLIKREIGGGDWYVWDTARGIVAGNDPHLSLNTTAAEVTTDDTIDPDSSGFIVNQVAATNVNVSSATYIFYAIA